MSGGAFDYLYLQSAVPEEGLRAMADWLRERQFGDAADATLALIPSEELRALWKAAEWVASADWHFEEAVKAYGAWRGEPPREGDAYLWESGT